jgi:hypothetical protein
MDRFCSAPAFHWQRRITGEAVFRRAKDARTTARTVPSKDAITIGTDITRRQQPKTTGRTIKIQFQFAIRTTAILFTDSRTTART